MAKFEFKMKSSGDDPYDIYIELEDSKLVFICDCQAGQNNLFCKHRKAVLKNDAGMAFDSESEIELQKAHDFLSDIGFIKIYQSYEAKLFDIDKDIKKLQKSKLSRKKQFGRELNEGLKIG